MVKAELSGVSGPASVSYWGFVNLCTAASKIRGTGWPCVTNAIQREPLTAKLPIGGRSMAETGLRAAGSSPKSVCMPGQRRRPPQWQLGCAYCQY